MKSEYEEISREAMAWVRAAGVIARDRFGKATVSHKADRSPVTDADHAVQAALQEAIARACPDDAVITEETQVDPERHASVQTARRCWVIDPIDGTRNYARSFPIFTLSVALMVEGRPVLGLVYDPLNETMVHALAGGGAWLEGERLAGPVNAPSGAIFITIPTSRHEKLPAVVHGWIDRMVVRNLGSTALHLALLARGALDAVYCRRCKLWDIAAGALLVTEVGGELRSLEGKTYFPTDLATYQNEEMPFLAGSRAVVGPLLDDYQKAMGKT